MSGEDAGIIGTIALAMKACRRKTLSKSKKPKPDFKKWDSWPRKLDNIKKELCRLYFAKGMFERLDKHFKNQNSLVSIYLHNTYVVYLGMGIRRLIDRVSNAQNLYKFLKDIEKNRKFISTTNLEKYFQWKRDTQDNKKPNDYKKAALNSFKEGLGGKRKILLSKEVAKDIASIKYIKETIEKYVDDTWAHMGKGKHQSGNLKQAHHAFDSIIEIYNRYSPLVGGKKFEPDDSVFFNQWDEPFRSP